ncbi:MAG UNVERIFIED_CONTAM: hypothetical protein LVQ98_03565 [Rickettsiaceae bacterium]|jgi:hypothetical protein
MIHLENKKFLGQRLKREDHEYYPILEEIISKRGEVAKEILSQYNKYREIITMVGINYTILESDAGLSKYKYWFSKDAPLQFHKKTNIFSLSSCDYEGVFRKYAPAINPDGEIKKRGNNITSGSISMNLETGLWHRFSNGDGGNILTFMKIAGKYSIYDAISSLPKKSKIINKNPIITHRVNDEWIPFKQVPKDVEAFNPTGALKHMMSQNIIESVYDYKNENSRDYRS